MATIPGVITRIHGKAKDEVDVSYDDKTVTLKNMLPYIKIGDYVIANDEIIIEILTERHAKKLMQH